MSIRRPQIVWHPSKEHCIKMCDYERDYVHELQRILFSYFKNDISIIAEKLKTIEDKNWKIFKQFEEEISAEKLDSYKGKFLEENLGLKVIPIDKNKRNRDTDNLYRK